MTKARALYSMALEKSPGNVEAMAGLADVARVQGDSSIAARYYDRVLAANPSYLPAIMGRADMKWAAGDRGGAVALYRRAVQQAGPGTSYGQRAQKRIDEYTGGGGASPAEDIPKAPAPSPSPAPAPAPAPAPETPNIDTSDLPGFN
jgi:Tfp pilus assembly protein PilF